MLEGRTRIILPDEGGTGTLYIPAGVVKDSCFPFRPNEEVLVRIRGRKLIIENEYAPQRNGENCAKKLGRK
jgi:hypothetical protein